MNTTWILVANAARARLFENTGIGKGLNLLSEFDHPQSRLKSADLVTDRAGFMQSTGNGQGAYQPSTDPKQNEATHFAHEIAQNLEHGRGQNKYERLILVAGAPFLGKLKSHLSHQTLALTSDTLEKDYTTSNTRDIGKHLEHCIYL